MAARSGAQRPAGLFGRATPSGSCGACLARARAGQSGVGHGGPVRLARAIAYGRPARGLIAWALLLALALLGAPRLAGAGTEDGARSEKAEVSRNIAVIMSYDPALPWSRSFLAGLSDAKKDEGCKVEYFVESLDMGRFGDAKSQDLFRNYLAKKYEGMKMDAVIVESFAAARFMQESGESIFGDVPYVVISSEPRERFGFRRCALISNRPWVEKTARMALEQNLQARRLLVVGDGSNPARALTDQIMKVVQASGRTLAVETMDGFTLDELEKKVAGMPRDSLVFFTLAFRDRAGNKLVPRDVMERLAAASNPPVYGYLDTFRGTGMVGGYLYCGKDTASLAVSMAMELAQGRVPDVAYGPSVATFDWRALKRWAIPEKALPEGSRIEFRPDSFLDKYFALTTAVACFFLAETILLAVMFRLWAQRRRLARKLQEAKAILEQRVAERTLELERLAVTDELTGLYNRREFSRLVHLEIRRASRGGPAFSLIMIDIDHFKDINDRLGHEAGDKVLRALAELLAGHLREQDTLARWGGEEFLAILPDTPLNRAVKAASKLRDILADGSVPVEGLGAIAVTASFGVACWDEAADGVDGIIRLADERLYLAKARGRNQVCSKSGG